MTGRLLIVVAVVAAPSVALAEWTGRGFDLPNLTWAATHIVIVEDGKVAESWKGDLKPGSKLPEGAAAFTRIKPGQLDPEWVERAGGKAPAVTGKRMILFLAHVPVYRQEDRGLVWMGAECPGFQRDSARNVAWIEGEQVYVLGGINHDWHRGLGSPGSLAGLKEQVGIGLDLRARFDAAQAEPDLKKRADRLGALVPTATNYADMWGPFDILPAVRECGAAGVLHLARWATEPKGKLRHDAWFALCGTGDTGLDAVLQVLDEQAVHWKGVAAGLKPGQGALELPESPTSAWGYTNGLWWVVTGVRGMRLSADNQKRVREHPALAELDRLLTAHRQLKPGGTRMEEAHARLRDIRAGHFRPED